MPFTPRLSVSATALSYAAVYAQLADVETRLRAAQAERERLLQVLAVLDGEEAATAPWLAVPEWYGGRDKSYSARRITIIARRDLAPRICGASMSLVSNAITRTQNAKAETNG